MTVPPVAEFINTLFSCTNFQWLVCAESQFFCQNGSVFEKISLETVVEKLFAGGFTFHIRTVEQNFLLSLDETEANILAYAPAEGIWKPFPLQRVKSDPNSVKLASLILFPHVPLPVRGEGGDSLISHFFPSSLFFEYSVKEKSPDGSPSLAFPKTPSAPSSCSNLRLFLKVDVHCGDDALHQVILTNDSLCVQSVQSNVIADYRKCFLIEVLSSNGLARIWTLSGKCWTAVGNHKVELTDVEDKKKEQLFWIDIKQAPHQADRLSVTFFSDPSSSYVSFDPVLGHLTLSKTEKTFVLTTKVSASSSSSSSSSSFSPSSSSSASYPSLQFSGSASSLPLSSIPLPRNFLPETAATVAFSALTPPPQHHELLLPPTFNTPPQQPHQQQHHHQQQQQQQQHFVPHQQQQSVQYQQSSSSSNQSPSEVKQLLTPASSSVPLPTAESYLPSAALMSELPQAFYAPIHSSLDSILPPPVYGHSIDYSSPSSSSSGVPFAPYATGPVLDVQKLEEKKKLEQDIENKRKELEHINLHLQKQNQIKQQNDHHLAQQNLQIQQSMVQIAAPTDASYVFSPQELNMLGFAQKLGEGTSGTVYRAVWNDLDVAVKAIRSDVPFSQSQTDDFLKEIAIMRDLRHPNILMFYGVVLNPLMMVMEFMEGGTLFQNLQKNITVNTSMALQWALQIARGMYYLHSRNPPMLHRDLKSLNVLINREGKAVLADFGFTIKQKNTVVTSLAGSVLWAAPEVLRQTPYDGKADVYSFGVLLYELAVRSPPYAGVSPNDVGTRVAQGTLRPTPLLHTSQAYRDLSERCLSYNPDHRPHFHEIVRILKAMIAANDCLWPYPPPPVRM